MNRVLKEPKLGTSLDGLIVDYSKYDLVITNPPYNTDKCKNRFNIY